MEDGLKISKNWPVLSLVVLLSSCAWLESMERSLVGEEGSARPSKNARRQSVSKAEYDQLLAKYEELNRQYQALKEGKTADPLVSELRDAPMIENGARVETVDAFTGNSPAAPAPAMPEVDLSDIEGQLESYRKAQAIKTANASEAMKLFQELAGKAIIPIRSRAQLAMGDLLLQQGEFDLALQAYEGIITKMSSSGAVLDALKGAAQCAEKLGLAAKKEEYVSKLRDIFQLGA